MLVRAAAWSSPSGARRRAYGPSGKPAWVTSSEDSLVHVSAPRGAQRRKLVGRQHREHDAQHQPGSDDRTEAPENCGVLRKVHYSERRCPRAAGSLPHPAEGPYPNVQVWAGSTVRTGSTNQPLRAFRRLTNGIRTRTRFAAVRRACRAQCRFQYRSFSLGATV